MSPTAKPPPRTHPEPAWPQIPPARTELVALGTAMYGEAWGRALQGALLTAEGAGWPDAKAYAYAFRLLLRPGSHPAELRDEAVNGQPPQQPQLRDHDKIDRIAAGAIKLAAERAIAGRERFHRPPPLPPAEPAAGRPADERPAGAA